MRSTRRSVAPGLLALAVLALAARGPEVLAAPASPELKKALKTGDAAAVKGALGTAASAGLDADTVKAILEASVGGRLRTLGVYEDLVAALGASRGEALVELTKGYEKQKRGDVRFVVIDALGRVPERSAEETLLKALKEDDDESVCVLAARQLGRRATASAVEGLIPLLADFEKDPHKTRLVREVNGALGALTGQSMGVAQDWQNYWTAHKGEFVAQAPQAPGAGAGSQSRDENALDRMRRERPADARTVEQLRQDDIIVVKGSSDQIERVLKSIHMPHTEHDRAEFDTLTLDPARQVLVLNCAGNAKLTPAGIAKVKEFVTGGGYLFSSDWELKNTLAEAFPECVEFLKETPRDPKEGQQVTIRPAEGAGNHPLMRDVFPLSTWSESTFHWQLDSRSHMVKDNPNLTVLVTSPEMQAMGSSTVAFTFSYPPGAGGRRASGGGAAGSQRRVGQVLHVGSHFKNQTNASGDGFALQQILLNFILEKQAARRQS